MGAPMNKKKTFQQLLAENCTDIAKRVSDDMFPNLFLVGGAKTIPVPHEAILYRWWFPEAFVKEVLVPYTRDYPSLKTLLAEVEKRQIDGKMYYALYFGKSINGYHRFCQHATGNIHISTLRRTLYGLCYDHIYNKEKEKDITAMLKECYYEWYAFDKEDEALVECVEAICIALGNYPLNTEGNPAINADWCKLLMEERSIK